MMSASLDRRARRAQKIAATLVVVLVLLELGVRVIERHLPEPLVWQSAEAQNKVRQMDGYAARGGASVAVLGTSVAISGIAPEIIDSALGGRQRVYNTALASGVPALMDPWTIDVVIPRLHPKLLVLGLTSYDLADEQQGFDFTNSFLASPAGLRATHRASPIDDVDWWLRHHVALWSNRIALRDPDAVLDAIRGEAPPVDHEVEATTSSGWLEFQTSFTPNLRVNVDHWAIGTRNVTALEHLAESARDQGIEVALIDMPVTDEYIARHPHGEADYSVFRSTLRDIAGRTGATVLEFDSLRDHSYFFDPVHLNATGAAVFTKQLVDALEAHGVLPVS